MESSQNKSSNVLKGGIIVTLLVIVLGGVVAFLWGTQIASLLGFGAQLEAAKMLPADTPFYVTLSPNLQNQAGYENLKTLYFDNPEIQNIFDEAQEDLSEGGIEFETDIQPWLSSEIAFAMPMVDLEADTPELQFLLATSDVQASEAFLDKLFTNQEEETGRSFEKKEYNGVSYWYQAGASEDEDQIGAIFKDFVIMTNSEALLAKIIDQSPETSLAENESFKTMMEALPANGVMFVLFNGSSLMNELTKMSEFEAVPPTLLQQTEAVGFAGMALTLQADGIQLDFAQQYDLEKLPESTRALLEQPANANEVLNRIPSDALFFVNASNLSQAWQQASQQMASVPEFEESLASMQQETGIDLEEDIFSWMTGEFALVLSEVNMSEPIPFAAYLLIGTDDTEAAQGGIDQLKSLLTNEVGLPITPQTISETEVEVINNPSTEEAFAAFGFLEDSFVLGIPDRAITTVVEAPNNDITSNSQFNTISQHLPDENTGYFYLNLEELRQIGESNLLGMEREEYDENVQPFLEPLRAIGGASELGLQNNSIQKTRFFFLITE